MSFPNRTLPLAAVLAAAAVIGVGGGAATYAALGTSTTTKTVVRRVTVASSEPAAAGRSLTINQIYQRSYRSVVELTVTSTGASPTPFGGSQAQQAQGSGFVYDTDGHIVTNQHVVDGARSISVRFWNGSTYRATVVGTDASTDLAVVKVDAPSSLLRPLALGNSSTVAVGDGVVAIGSPFGLAETVTSGIVSALHRQISSPNNFAIANAIQTDAAINHGNSGGPLLNSQGQVIGVNAQIESDSGGNDGVGFAIPSNTVSSVASQLIATGKAEHAYLGVSVGNQGANGARINSVRSGTPAQRAGLRSGDVITAVDGEQISSGAELQSAIDGKRPGDTVSITYRRGGKSTTVDVKLGTRPS